MILGLSRLSEFIAEHFEKNINNFNDDDKEFYDLLLKCEQENPWFTYENQKFALLHWSTLLKDKNLTDWLSDYRLSKTPKRVGLILAGNIPLVGFHDVLAVILSGHHALIKLSSKDTLMIPYLLKKWSGLADEELDYEIIDRLEDFDAVIATGSNNTARYLEYYFKDHLSIIRKNRTSVGVLSGEESDAELKLLSQDIFRYFGLGCRNVTRLFIPEGFKLDRLFENFFDFKEVINHHKYANNYDYNKAIYLLDQDLFWDNNFVLLKEDEKLFSPLSVINFSRYKDLSEVKEQIKTNEADIQCVVASPNLKIKNSITFGEAQTPGLSTYADNIDTMRFLEVL